MNGFKTGRIKLYSFRAGEGRYKLDLTQGRSISKIEEALAEILPLEKIDL